MSKYLVEAFDGDSSKEVKDLMNDFLAKNDVVAINISMAIYSSPCSAEKYTLCLLYTFC